MPGTGGWNDYVCVGRKFIAYSSIDHAAGESVRQGHHYVSEAHLSHCRSEFDFRYSNREDLGIADAMCADEILKGSTGKRLTYRRTGEGALA